MPDEKILTLSFLVEKAVQRARAAKRSRLAGMANLVDGHAKLTQYLKKKFWGKVKIGPDDACWPWLGATYVKTERHLPYGKAGLFDYKTTAHRASYLIFHGQIPMGKDVCHTCDNPPCCNPEHLFLGDDFTNQKDSWSKGRGKCPNIKGEKSALAKLTEANVIEIRKLKKEGWSHSQIAKKFGICFQNSSRITLGISWKHVI